MNVAIVLTGHLRCWEQVFPNFKANFIDRYSPDIFIHTWKDEGYWVPQEGRLGIKEGTPLIDEAAVRAAYNPVELVVEDFMDFEPTFAERVVPFTNYYHRPRNIVSMFYKMGVGIQLMEKHSMKTGKVYNLVIRMRPDMLIHEPMPDFDPAGFYTLAHRNHMGGGTGDMFQIGAQNLVTGFSKIGTMLETIYAKTGLLCPHVFSVEFIKMLNLPWQEFSINKTLQHTPAGPYQAV